MQTKSSTIWLVAGASVRGVGHVRSGQVCQDAFAFVRLPGGEFVAAVADGAGSAPLSDVGAALATESVIAAFKTTEALPQASDATRWQRRLSEAMRQAQIRIAAEATIRLCEPDAMATTLLLAVATSELTAVMQIGDGAMAGGNDDGNVVALTVPQNGEYANTTVFLTSPGAIETAQFALHPSFTHIALFSDGLQRIALDMANGEPFAPFFLPLFRFMASTTTTEEAQVQLAAFLSSPRVQERTDDDITLVLASHAPR